MLYNPYIIQIFCKIKKSCSELHFIDWKSCLIPNNKNTYQ